MSTTKIRSALEKRLNSLSNKPVIAWENVLLDPLSEDIIIRSKLSVTSVRPVTISSNLVNLYEGIFFTDVATKEGTGPQEADALVNRILLHFPVGLILNEDDISVRIRYSEYRQGLQDTPWYLVPVEIGWFSYI